MTKPSQDSKRLPTAFLCAHVLMFFIDILKIVHRCTQSEENFIPDDALILYEISDHLITLLTYWANEYRHSDIEDSFQKIDDIMATAIRLNKKSLSLEKDSYKKSYKNFRVNLFIVNPFSSYSSKYKAQGQEIVQPKRTADDNDFLYAFTIVNSEFEMLSGYEELLVLSFIDWKVRDHSYLEES